MKKILAAALFSAVIFSGCSQQQTPTTTTSAASPNPSPVTGTGPTTGQTQAMATLDIQNFAFSPATLTVKPGQTVKVTNHDSVQHDVAANDGSFRVPLLGKEESATFVAPTKPGSYPFVCEPHHQKMMGTLVVQ